MSVLTDLRNRGVKDVFFVVCDGLKGLPEVVSNVWPAAIVQTCIIHLIRNTFRLASTRVLGRHSNATSSRSTPRSTPPRPGPRSTSWPTSGAARYPAVIRLWDNAWDEFIPFLDYDVEIRRVICSTNAIESLERPLPAGDQGPRPLPVRAGRVEVSLPGHPITGPDRHRTGTMDDAVEASAQRIRDHLRRPLPGRRNLLTETAGNTVSEIDPVATCHRLRRRRGDRSRARISITGHGRTAPPDS